ncbi:LigA [Paraburkholderia graminis C4D1M]|uniref:LigA n=1 Tax=Paraburkholderia graminis (strain ATCC 700544 / DSM 17151 / LMG 18924 / NCIMB 13744 / C4D1M) TaxID=396598 RepID=B1GAL5_PARG4|nr:LigA [Paraburkholderia graminis C4D1M]
MAEGRFDFRERCSGRHGPTPCRRKRRSARRRTLAGGAVARGADRTRRGSRGRGGCRGCRGGTSARSRAAARLSFPRRNRHAGSRRDCQRQVARSGERVRAAHHAAIARRVAARAVALGRRASVCDEPVSRILVRRGERRPRSGARRGRAVGLSGSGSSAAGRMGSSDAGAVAHAARTHRKRGFGRDGRVHGESRTELARCRAKQHSRSAFRDAGGRVAVRARHRSSCVP